ncbi:Rhodanese-related sulfurtransferase [Capnocytophaga haemolytica]|uniref:Probable adenylyltransferase/sulfurtransferase MoeZ n=1 Tax=Capnocytophaga haemolytica TaxID=45243 RepID=A0AAX2H1E1_9FLAO|nr:rhodanese-like domain-containing protein [Capnocytophaga haemolytica]AMD85607.1 hypothetical protein AXF12_08835 [Capnocytophaga haemolytica]SFN88639.1 Rhodanese-related sulfurtransferase [Capnocytophaga haemolytica]SNV16808.1 Probable adenylyltransferase/sulfurtransferase MoeZ [Capnocytophaga haemolytica]
MRKHIPIESYSPVSGQVLIDVRTPEEFAQGHIEGAVNINFFDPDFVSLFRDEVPKEMAFYIYCKSGGRSSKAVALLEGLGYEGAIHLDGGFDRWVCFH